MPIWQIWLGLCDDSPHAMRSGSIAKVLAECKLEYYRISECHTGSQEEEHNTQMTLGDGLQWNPASCWDDLEAAIKQAKVMVYIVGAITSPLTFIFRTPSPSPSPSGNGILPDLHCIGTSGYPAGSQISPQVMPCSIPGQAIAFQCVAKQQPVAAHFPECPLSCRCNPQASPLMPLNMA